MIQKKRKKKKEKKKKKKKNPKKTTHPTPHFCGGKEKRVETLALNGGECRLRNVYLAAVASSCGVETGLGNWSED